MAALLFSHNLPLSSSPKYLKSNITTIFTMHIYQFSSKSEAHAWHKRTHYVRTSLHKSPIFVNYMHFNIAIVIPIYSVCLSKARLYVGIYAECSLKGKWLQKVLQTLPLHSVDSSWLFLVHIVIFGSSTV